MHDINLMPWRETKRKNRRQLEWVFLMGSIFLCVVFVLFVHHFYVREEMPKLKNSAHFPKIIPHIHYKWIGYLRSENNYLAFLQDPKGKMFSVEVGSELGGARVIRINESGVLLERNQKQEWIGHAI